MAKGNYYCEECVEEISDEDVFWEGNRAYCGRCGSELDLDEGTADVVEQMASRKLRRPAGTDYDDEEDEEREGEGLEGEDEEEDENGEEEP
jgi:hypothetical protein